MTWFEKRKYQVNQERAVPSNVRYYLAGAGECVDIRELRGVFLLVSS